MTIIQRIISYFKQFWFVTLLSAIIGIFSEILHILLLIVLKGSFVKFHHITIPECLGNLFGLLILLLSS